MSKLDDILHDTAATIYCSGQDYKKGDGSALKIDEHVSNERNEIKKLLLDIVTSIEEDLSGYDQLSPEDYVSGVELKKRISDL